MSFTYPLTLPASPSRVELRQEDIQLSSFTAFTAQEKFIEMAGKYWSISLTFPPLSLATARLFQAFFGQLKGRQGTFLAGDPSATAPAGSNLGTALIGAGQTIGSTLSTKGWNVTETGVLLAGDYIQLGSGETTRLYQVLTDVDSDGSGLATIDVWPDVRGGEVPIENEALVLTLPKGTFRLVSNLRTISIDATLLSGIGFSAREAL